MGGMHGFGPATWDGADDVFHHEWERRVFALMLISGYERLRKGSGRIIREEMDPAAYLEASYYERWHDSVVIGMERQGTITGEELDAMVERIRAGHIVPERDDPAQASRMLEQLGKARPRPDATDARFHEGDRVRVRRMRPRGHTRCPRYLRGCEGVVEHVQPLDSYPDDGFASTVPVYAVRFRSEEVFGETEEPPFTILADMFEPYLEAC
jgi:nitrile hydratase subunit beta